MSAFEQSVWLWLDITVDNSFVLHMLQCCCAWKKKGDRGREREQKQSSTGKSDDERFSVFLAKGKTNIKHIYTYT